MRTPQRNEWLVIVATAVAVVALVPPTPHWRETTSQSCHLCGNRRVIIRDYRWWQFDEESIEPAATFPVPDGHFHDWWQYAATFNSYNGQWAADNGNRYRDGRNAWTP
jgi:hypothetical protein